MTGSWTWVKVVAPNKKGLAMMMTDDDVTIKWWELIYYWNTCLVMDGIEIKKNEVGERGRGRDFNNLVIGRILHDIKQTCLLCLVKFKNLDDNCAL